LVIAGSGARRAALERLLRGAAIQVVGVLPGTAGASAYIEHWQPDAVLIDLDLGRQSAASLMVLVSGSFSGLAVVVLADHLEATVIARMLRSGVASILQRDSSPEQIAAAIEAAAEELVVLGADVAQVMVARNSAASTKGLRDDADDGSEDIEPLIEELTPRELEVLRMVAAGLANREIASRLGISGHTIKFHISSILGKLGASSRTEAVTHGIKRGLILL